MSATHGRAQLWSRFTCHTIARWTQSATPAHWTAVCSRHFVLLLRWADIRVERNALIVHLLGYISRFFHPLQFSYLMHDLINGASAAPALLCGMLNLLLQPFGKLSRLIEA
jgi:hypothetical protein